MNCHAVTGYLSEPCRLHPSGVESWHVDVLMLAMLGLAVLLLAEWASRRPNRRG